MIVRPLIKGTLCAAAHPDGCRRAVLDQIAWIERRSRFAGPRTALVVGCSMGLGLGSRIALAFGAGTATFGLCHERPGNAARTATAGWYNAASFDAAARDRGLRTRTLVGDAFGSEAKARVVQELRESWGPVDLFVYSVASRQRRNPATGQLHVSSLKAVGKPYSDKAVNPGTGEIFPSTLPVATQGELADTVAVMGGEDWSLWLDALDQAGLIAPRFRTLSYSYVGPARFHPTYRTATIGYAKEHLEATARAWDDKLLPKGGKALVAVMKALVTQSSIALPMGILYTVLLARVLSERGLGENAIEQCYRLLSDELYGGREATLDEEGRVRLDDRELRADVQREIARRWDAVDTTNLGELGDLTGFNTDFRRLYGFDVPGVDYSQASESMPAWATALDLLAPTRPVAS